MTGPNAERRSLLRMTLLAVVLASTAFVAGRAGTLAPMPEAQAIVVVVLDEVGDPISGAVLGGLGSAVSTDTRGHTETEIAGPTLVVIEASGHLPEPIVLMPDQPLVEVSLLAREGPTGDRVALHFGGDFMLGRRYQEPGRSRTAVVLNNRDARDMVKDLAPLFSAADLGSVNFESVFGRSPMDEAAAAKRFLIQTPDYGLGALDALGVDVVTLGNNHIYDWLDPGIDRTLAAFDRVGMPYAGVGLSDGTRIPVAMVETPTATVAVVSYTSINGDVVNEFLPTDESVAEGPVAPEQQWMWEPRAFGHGEPGEEAYVSPSGRRPGSAYAMFVELERGLEEGEAGALWSALVDVYPELQDWVARRGHGGALPAIADNLSSDIEAARAAGADVVVVEIHGGTQFASSPASFHREMSRKAIDAGADLVVNHHPHVLQGLEWYQGRLIAHSLGNVVFDQDFLETLDGVVLRAVFEGDRLVQARLYPIALIDYRPVPVGGGEAERILRTVYASSLSSTVMDRTETKIVVRHPDSDQGEPARLVLEHGTARVLPGPVNGSEVTLEPGRHMLARPAVVRVDAGTGVAIGHDLLGWGSPADDVADGELRGGVLWRAEESIRHDTTDGWVLTVSASTSEPIRPVLRIPVDAHRVRTLEDVPAPLDGPATYSVVLQARGEHNPKGIIQVTQFRFDDSDPTTDPVDEVLDVIRVEFSVTDGWRLVEVALPALDPAATRLRLRISVEDTERRAALLHLKDVQFLEWRLSAELPPGWYPADAFRAETTTTVRVAAP